MARTITVPDDIADALQATGFTIPQGNEIQAVSIDAQAFGVTPGLVASLLKAIPTIVSLIGGEKFKQILATLPALITAALAKDWAAVAKLVAELLAPLAA